MEKGLLLATESLKHTTCLPGFVVGLLEIKKRLFFLSGLKTHIYINILDICLVSLSTAARNQRNKL